MEDNDRPTFSLTPKLVKKKLNQNLFYSYIYLSLAHFICPVLLVNTHNESLK